MPWKVVGASVLGSDHENAGKPCEDAHTFEVVDEILIAAVADGAGSARRGGEGAEVCSDTVVSFLSDQTSFGLFDSESSFTGHIEAVVGAIRAARQRIRAKITEKSLRYKNEDGLETFNATLVGVVANPNGGFLFHIGDGAALAARADDLERATVSPPENGDFVEETYFFTMDNWREHLRITPFERCNLIMIATDGASCFSFAEGGRAAAPAFMKPLTQYLEEVEESVGEKTLTDWLCSDPAQAVSGDDKTLLWARYQ